MAGPDPTIALAARNAVCGLAVFPGSFATDPVQQGRAKGAANVVKSLADGCLPCPQQGQRSRSGRRLNCRWRRARAAADR